MSLANKYDEVIQFQTNVAVPFFLQTNLKLGGHNLAALVSQFEIRTVE